MELDLSDEQELLRETAARFIDSTSPLPSVRQLIESDTGLPEGYLRAAGELGWFAMLVPEEHGGGSVSGEGLRDLAIIAEERGRVLQPGPFVSMNVVASSLAVGGSTELQSMILPALCRGETVATWVPGAGDGLVPGTAVTATTQGDAFALSGYVGQVEAGGLADWILVSAVGVEGPVQFIVPTTTPGVTVTPLRGLDITQRLSTISFDHSIVPASSMVGQPGLGDRDVVRQLHLACILSTSETVGAMDALFEMTRQYAVDRTAFGRPDRFLSGAEAPIGRPEPVSREQQGRRGRRRAGAARIPGRCRRDREHGQVVGGRCRDRRRPRVRTGLRWDRVHLGA